MEIIIRLATLRKNICVYIWLHIYICIHINIDIDIDIDGGGSEHIDIDARTQSWNTSWTFQPVASHGLAKWLQPPQI